jgi:hypothetical protein
MDGALTDGELIDLMDGALMDGALMDLMDGAGATDGDAI